MEVEKRRGIQIYKSNPFLSDLSTNQKSAARRVINKKTNMMFYGVNGSTGEILEESKGGFWQYEEVDTTKFVKLFVNGVKALADLTSAGTKVFELLYNEVQQNPNKDTVFLSYTNYTDSIGESVFRRGLAELVRKQFIAAQRVQGWFWVNPDFLWNGDRLLFVKEYRKAKKKVVDERQLDLIEALPPGESA